MRRRFIIAIDGPAGAGKSTIAKLAAKKLGYRYVDTGAMYRSIAYKALKLGLDLHDQAALTKLADKSKFNIRVRKGEFQVYLDGENTTYKIRSVRVTQATHQVASVRGVRRALVALQRRIGRNGGITMEGRDIGTIVFPKAEFKFYLDASPGERALRRYRELKARGRRVSLERIAQAISRRDKKDRERGISPLRTARDAIVIDSTHMTLNQVADRILCEVRSGKR